MPSGGSLILGQFYGRRMDLSFIRLFRLFHKGQKHGSAFPVLSVSVAKKSDQIMLFQLDGYQNVARRSDGKHEMAERHLWRRPECDQEAEIKRMTDLFVEHWCLEPNRRLLFAHKVESDLAQPEKIEMVDHKRATQDTQPPDPIEHRQSRVTCGVLHVPHYFGHGPPLPKEQVQTQARHHHVCAALNRLGNDSRP